MTAIVVKFLKNSVGWIKERNKLNDNGVNLFWRGDIFCVEMLSFLSSTRPTKLIQSDLTQSVGGCVWFQERFPYGVSH